MKARARWQRVGGCRTTLTADYENTSLKPYVAMLEKHARAIIADRRAGKPEVKKESMEF